MKARTLIDPGCTSMVVSSRYVRQHALERIQAAKPVKLKLADGKLVTSMTHLARLQTSIGDHVTEDLFWIADITGFDIIVGEPWMEEHNPSVDWAARTVTFNSDHCTRNCLWHGLPVKVTCRRDGNSRIENPDPYKKPPARHPKAPQTENITFISAYAAMAMARRDQDTFWKIGRASCRERVF